MPRFKFQNRFSKIVGSLFIETGEIMILIDLKHYLQKNKCLSINDLALHFDLSHDAIRGMLDHWIAKSRVKKLRCWGECRKGCFSCNKSAKMELYEWVI